MKIIYAALLTLSLAACSTTPDKNPIPTGTADGSSEGSGSEVVIYQPDVPDIIAAPNPAPPRIEAELPPPPPPVVEPPIVEIYETVSLYDSLAFWQSGDHRPALAAFKQTCESYEKADAALPLSPNLPEYGLYADWLPACFASQYVASTQYNARQFFEQEFLPVNLSLQNETEGLLTGYYEPEVQVRKIATSMYSEPILARPTNEATMKLPRSKLNAGSSRVIAYGRPIEVFFLQIQGSGRLQFADGTSFRAAYGGNNGYKYTSIGRVLIDRGKLTKDRASKRDIEAWMEKSGPKKTRELLNKNKRYIFFTEQAITPGEGPQGGMRVPLTPMGSIAIDRRYHPYGTLAWLETKIPSYSGDYRGIETGLLVSAQDTGSAIKGPLRGDLFFGPGDQAGALAGVMKHPVAWTILLPVALAMRQGPVS